VKIEVYCLSGWTIVKREFLWHIDCPNYLIVNDHDETVIDLDKMSASRFNMEYFIASITIGHVWLSTGNQSALVMQSGIEITSKALDFITESEVTC